MKNGTWKVALAIVGISTAVACGDSQSGTRGRNPNTPPNNQAPVIEASRQSECQGSPAPRQGTDSATIEALVAGNSITIVDREVVDDCNAPYGMTASVEGNRITILELGQAHEPVDCLCVYSLSITIRDLPAGTYLIDVARQPDGLPEPTPIASLSATIVGSQPSACTNLTYAECISVDGCMVEYLGICDCECADHQAGGGCADCSAACFVPTCVAVH